VAAIPTQVDAFDVFAAIAALWKRRLLIAIVMVLVTAAFVTDAYVTTPIYRSEIVMIPSNDRNPGGALGNALGSLGGLAAVAGINLGGTSAESEEALAVLRSREFSQRFIEDKNLLPLLFADKWDAANRKWKTNDGQAPSLGRAFKRFDNEVRSISQDKKTTLVKLSIDWWDREQAAEWANELVARLNQEMRDRAKSKAEASLKFLQEELANTLDVSTREAVGRLIEAQVKQRMVANVTPEYAFRVVDRALVSDKNDRFRPQRALLILSGPLAGFVIGIALVMFLEFYARFRARIP
jgi:uncharacterized protein involved in exopolysaccharide biosynthesis